MRLFTFLIFTCLLAGSCKQEQKNNIQEQKNSITENQAQPLIADFFKGLQDGKYSTALQDLLTQNENINLKDSSTAALINGFNIINQVSGQYIDNQLLKKRVVADAIAMYTYLVRYDKKFYRFTFVYYNNKSKTKLYKFTYDDAVDLEMEESLKLYTTE